MEAKDCMESNKGAAGSGIKDEMGGAGMGGGDLAVHQQGESPGWK